MSTYIKYKYLELCDFKCDINEHLPTLFRYAKQCNSAIELGVRGCISSYALCAGLLANENNIKKKILLNDINDCSEDIKELYNNNNFELLDLKYEWCNDLDLNMTENYDLTFIDTWHVYPQLIRELNKFSKITNKYLIMHDTTVDEYYGESVRDSHNIQEESIKTGFPEEEIRQGLRKAVDEFLSKNNDWVLEERFTNNNGLTILKKK